MLLYDDQAYEHQQVRLWPSMALFCDKLKIHVELIINNKARKQWPNSHVASSSDTTEDCVGYHTVLETVNIRSSRWALDQHGADKHMAPC